MKRRVLKMLSITEEESVGSVKKDDFDANNKSFAVFFENYGRCG